MKKRALSWLLALTMLLTLAPQTLPVWASATGEKSNTATQTESKLSANTYSALGLSRTIDENQKPSGQPYGNGDVGSTIATNVINELYVNFNGSIHYGWSILDKLTMQCTDQAGDNWTSKENSQGAMSYWRYGQQPKGSTGFGALYASGGKTGTLSSHIDRIGDTKSSSISSANTHLVHQYSKSEAFSPNTGKDNYVAELVVDYNGDVYLYLYQVEGGNKRRVCNKTIGHNPFVGDKDNKANIIWNWEYDAMFDIAAGDMDGDGYDEIAVFTATGTGSDDQAVHLYKYTGGALQEITKQVVTKPNNNNATGKNLKLGTAVVTLAFGDLNADDKDELVIAENMGYGATNINDGKVGIYALENNELAPKKSISLVMSSDDSGVVTARYVNVATGDVDNDNQDELVIAGYGGAKLNIGVFGGNIADKSQVYYNIVDGKDYSVNGWKTVTFDKNNLLGRVVDNSNQLIPPVSLTCAATQGVGYAEQVFLSGCLYRVDTTQNSGTGKNEYSLTKLTEISTNREYKKDDGKKANKEEIFVLNVVAGNFNGNEYGQEQIVYAFGMKHDDSDRYWYDIGYLNKKDYGNTNETVSSGYWYGQEQVMNYESSYNRDSKKSRASLYLSLAAVDCDDDSTLMRYTGQEITWTKPEVLTVLQSAPYFQDLQDTRDYLDQSQTAYGTGHGTSTTATAGASLTLGTYVSFEQDFSVFGVKIASIEAEAQTKHSFEYGFEGTKEKKINITYSGSAGDDYAIVYAVPYIEYQYETWIPGYKIPEENNGYDSWKTEYVGNYLKGKLKNWSALSADEQKKEIEKAVKELNLTPGREVQGSWQPSTVSVPMDPAKVLISVDAYDEIAAQTEGLEPIRGNILKSTPGDPSTYDSFGANSKFHLIGSTQTVSTGAGGNVSIEEDQEASQTHTFSYSYEFEAKAGVGAGGLTVGVLAGVGTNAGGGTGESSSKSCSATVDNLPSDATGYAFSWRFGTRKAKLNGNDVLVLEYQIDKSSLQQPPSPPRNLRVESVTADSVTLEWDKVPGAGSYEIYQTTLTETEDPVCIATVPGTATSYTDQRVLPNNSYTYYVKNVTPKGKSIFSTSIKVSTLLQNDGRFVIEEQPGSNHKFQTYVGGTATATVKAKYVSTDGGEKSLIYIWKKYNSKTKRWENYMSGSETLSVPNVTKNMEGDKFRCQVFYTSGLYMYTEPITLEVGKAETTTAMTGPDTNSTVNASYVEIVKNPVKDDDGQPVYEQVAVTKKIGDTTYTEYTTERKNKIVYLSGDDYYSISNETPTKLTTEDSPIQLYYDDADDTTEVIDLQKSSMIQDLTYPGEGNAKVSYTKTDDQTNQPVIYEADKKYTIGTIEGTIETYCTSGRGEEDDFWFVKIGTDENGQNKYAPATLEKETTIDPDSINVKVSELRLSTTQGDQMFTSEQVFHSGDTVSLRAKVTENAGFAAAKIEGSVAFKIVNSVGDGSGTVTGTIGEDGVATATWKPSVAGVYTITAAYEGSEIHMGSASAGSITINVVVPGEKKLVIDSPNSMTYGDAAIDLKATLLSGAGDNQTGSAQELTSGVTYYVNDVAIEGKIFNPTAAGTYTIKATYINAGETLTATKTINVSKRTVKIVPKVENNVTSYTLENIVSADDSLFNGKINVTCAGVTTGAAAGQYPINVTYTPGDKETEINSKYLVLVDTTQVYTVSDDVVQVTNATTDSNGKVKLQYTDNKGNTYDVGENGQTLDVPKGVTLTATAMPNVGYRVEKWTEKVGDNTEALIFSSAGVYNTSNVITQTNLQTKYSIKADFTLTYYNLKMGFATGSSGSIIAKYLNDAGTEGDIFYDSNSPSITPTTATQQLSPLKKVRITATPANDQVISGWRIYSGTDSEGTLVKNDDGTTYTGNTYTVSSINANTQIVVETAEKTERTIKVTLVGQDGDKLGSQASVSFNGGAATKIENGTYTYSTAQHDNVVINLTVPDSLIVDSWKIGDTEQNVGTLSNNKKTLSISNLQLTADSLELTVHCKAPNSYPVTVTQKIGETTVTNAADITIKKNGTDDTVNWSSSDDNKVPEATILRVIIQEKPGYELQSVSCNGTVQTTQDTQGGKAFTIDGVRAGVNIVATFKKLAPYTVTFSVSDTGGGANGNLSATAERKGKKYEGFGSGSTVYEGATVTFTATPDEGYRVKEWQVDGSVYEDAGTSTILTLRPEKNTKVTVQFTPIGDTATFSTGENGRITSVKLGEQEVPNFAGGFVLTPGASIEVTAEPAVGYEVEQWLVNGVKQSETGNTLTYTAQETGSIGAAISVSFQQVKYSVTWGGTDGTVAATGYNGNSADIRGGTDVTFTATPANGCKFDHWTVNGVREDVAATTNTFTWTVPNGKAADTPVNAYNIQAVCVPDTQSYTVTYAAEAPENGTVTTPGGDGGSITVAAGTNLTFTATPNQYYHVKTWKLDGDSVDGSANQNTYTLSNVAAAHTVTVVFDKAVSYTVGYQVEGGNGTLTATKNGTDLTLTESQTDVVPAGSKLVFTAVPATGNMVEKWTVNDTEVTRDNMKSLGVTMEHYLSNTLTIDSLDRNVTVKVKFTQYAPISIPTGGTGYTITTDKRIPAETYTGASTSEIRKNGDLTFTVQPNKTSDKNYNAITKLVVNGYDCIAKSGTATNCDSLEAVKNANGSYTITIRNIEALTINADTHQLVIGDLTVPTAFEGNDELNTVEKIKAKLETRLTARKDGTAFYDIVLKAADGTIISGANFPANGVDVVLPYPTGTDSKDDFRIVHMLTTGANAGDIQNVKYTKESNGLHFHVDSLSPFGVSWVKYVAPTPGGGGGGGGGAVSTCTLTFDTNGGSAIDKITKDSGTTIDLAAYKPTRAGYTFAGWFSDKALTKAVTSVKLTANTTVYAKWTQNGSTAENPFVDVKEGAYYYDAVLWAVEQKITSGTSATTFSPDASCTRAQMVTFLWRAAGSPKVENGKNPFTDVKADAYYYDAVLWAVEKGVTSGTSATTFSPDATVTRGQTVTFLYRNAGSPEVSGTMPFTDVEADAYYAKAVQWAVQQKITTGTSETTFSPMSDCTRGQIVTFLYRAK